MEYLEQRITSVELCDLINQLRKEEKGLDAKKLRHIDLMTKIRKISNSVDSDFIVASYIDKKCESRPCFSLNVSGLQKLLGVTKFSADVKGICECIKRLGGDERVVYSLNRKEIEFGGCLKETLKPFNLEIQTQLSVCNNKYRIDFYIPSLNIAIEYDEDGHKNYSYEKQEGRQKEIEGELGCRFIRVTDENSHSFNVGQVIKEIFNICGGTFGQGE